jgi:hypothetical protein
MASRSGARKILVLAGKYADRELSGGVRSVVAEQPDPWNIPWHIKPRRLGHEGLPRLGRFADTLLDRLQFALARLAIAAFVGPLLMALGAALFGGRALDIGVARFHIAVARFGERLARRSDRLTRGRLGRPLDLRW